MTAVEKIIEYFKENEQEMNSAMEELDSYNGFLNDDRYYSMEKINELFSSPLDALEKARCGHDEESYETDAEGNRTYDRFNPFRPYFRSDGCGNLVSAEFKDYTGLLDEYFVEQLYENRSHLWATDEPELAELLDEMEKERENENE